MPKKDLTQSDGLTLGQLLDKRGIIHNAIINFMSVNGGAAHGLAQKIAYAHQHRYKQTLPLPRWHPSLMTRQRNNT